MNLTPELQALIEKYLDDSLAGEALQAFKKQLETNEALVQEVAFQRELKEFLADSPENELRKNLQMLNEQVEDPKSKGPSWKIGFLLLPFFFLGVWWVFNSQVTEARRSDVGITVPPKPTPPVDKDTQKIQPIGLGSKASIPLDSIGSKPIDSPINISTEDSTLTDEPPVPPADSIGNPSIKSPVLSTDSIKGPIASGGELSLPDKEEVIFHTEEPLASLPPADLRTFERNEALEALIQKNNTNELFQLTTNHWPSDFEIATLTDSLTFNWTDSLTSQAALLEKGLQLHLFSNDPAQFQTFLPIATNDLPLQKLSDSTYQLIVQQNYLLSPGRYYFVVQDAAEETIYFVERIFVQLAE